jgi:anti-sigma regulatory factor (Ser/Thr protein kinase)
MTPYLAMAVSEQSQVGEARRVAARLAQDMAFDAASSGRLALVVTELATNLARHAQRGRLLLGSRTLGVRPCLEVLSLDHGPGMADVDRCLQDGFSTGGTPGSGLGAVRRLSDAFSVFSAPGLGTVISARVDVPGSKGPAPGADAAQFELAGICLAAPGETACGDAWDVSLHGDRARVMVADGLGHGPVAAEASDAAIKVFRMAGGTPAAVLERAHENMRSTRGAAVAMAELDTQASTVTFVGAGNIAGRIVSGVHDRSLMSQHGTLGVQIRRLNEAASHWPAHSLLILHSDGIISRWSLADVPGLLRCDPAVVAGWLIRDYCRGRDDATVVVVRRAARTSTP